MGVYPGALPAAGTAVPTATLVAAGHTALHNTDADEIRALATKLGTGASTPTAGTLLKGTGAGTSAWQALDMSTDLTGTLPVNRGGTGQTTLTDLPLTTPVIGDFTNATHDHTSAAEGGTLGADSVNTTQLVNSAVTDDKITDDTITGIKQSTTNIEVRRAASAGVDTTGTSYITAVTFTDLNIPTWATKAIVTWTGKALVVTSVTDIVVRVLIGGTDASAEEYACYSSYPVNVMFSFSFVHEITLTGTGVKAFIAQIRESAGAGAGRVSSSVRWTAKVEYY